MMQGFSRFFQEDEVQHVVFPYMNVHLYLTDQNGVELRNFCEEEDIFLELQPQNIQGCLPPFQPPKYCTRDSF
jgi:hypothetical protein